MAQIWSRNRFGLALVVLLCMLAMLCLSPWTCSALFLAWNEEHETIYKESQGNSSFMCKPSGPCMPCSHFEKQADKYSCKTSGYHQPYKCVEMKTKIEEKVDLSTHEGTETEEFSAGKGDASTEIRTSESEARQKKEMEDVDKVVEELHERRRLQSREGDTHLEVPNFTLESGLRVYHTYKVCRPAEPKEDKFTVLQFEGIVIASLALCSPLVYYRRRHNVSASGMTRIPNNARF